MLCQMKRGQDCKPISCSGEIVREGMGGSGASCVCELRFPAGVVICGGCWESLEKE